MSPSCCRCADARPVSAADDDAQMRRLCRGRTSWSAEDLKKLQRLTAAWNALTREGVACVA